MNNQPILVLNRSDLRDMLLKQNHSATVSFISITPPKMLAKSKDGTTNPFVIGTLKSKNFTFGRVRKQGGIIGADYDTMVENRNEKEIEAERAMNNLPPLSEKEMEEEIANRFRKGTGWWRYILDASGKPTVLAVNKNDARGDEGNAYLVFSLPTAISDTEEVSLKDGVSIPYEKIKPFMVTGSDYSNQGLSDENKVQIRTIELSNIIEIVINKNRYRIIDNFGDRPLSLRNRLWSLAEEFLNGTRKMSKV